MMSYTYHLRNRDRLRLIRQRDHHRIEKENEFAAQQAAQNR